MNCLNSLTSPLGLSQEGQYHRDLNPYNLLTLSELTVSLRGVQSLRDPSPPQETLLSMKGPEGAERTAAW